MVFHKSKGIYTLLFLFLNMGFTTVFATNPEKDTNPPTPADQIMSVVLNVNSDGTPVFDADDSPGNDSGPNNGIIRAHDIIELQLFYSTDAGGGTDMYFSSTLPEGLVWDGLPTIVAQDPRSKIVDSGTGLEDGDDRTIIAYVPDAAGAYSGNLIFEVRALGGNNGTPLNGVFFEGHSNETPTPVMTASYDFTLSAAPFMDLYNRTVAKGTIVPNETNTADGVMYFISVGIIASHPTRTGAEMLKGNSNLTDDVTFDLDLSTVSPNAVIYDWGDGTDPNVPNDGNDGVVRNAEIYTNDSDGTRRVAWADHGMPNGKYNDDGSYLDKTKTIPNSGDWTVLNQTGQNYTIQLSGLDSRGQWIPPLHRHNGDLFALDLYYFAAGRILVWVPISDIDAGEDGVAGTEDDGQLTMEYTLENFDPNSADGLISNYGAGLEPLTNNTRTPTILSTQMGGVIHANYWKYGAWNTILETKTNASSADGETAIGHKMNINFIGGSSNGILPVNDIQYLIKFDNTAQKLLPLSIAAAFDSGNPYSAVRIDGGGIDNGGALTYGTDYIVEFGVGGLNGAGSSWATWQDMRDADGEDAQSPVWTQDPTDPALGGTPDPVTGISDAITKIRFKFIRPLESGARYRAFLSVETKGLSTVDPTLNPDGTITTIMAAHRAGYFSAGNWTKYQYFPETGVNSGGNPTAVGDRLLIVGADVSIEKNFVDLGSGNVFLAGTDLTYTLDGTVTTPGTDTGIPAQSVVVEDILPTGMTVVNGTASPAAGSTYTAGDGSTQAIQSIEYYNGSTWGPTYSTGASGIRWNFGDVPLNTTLPQLQFDANIPFSAAKDQEFTNVAEISSPSDPTPGKDSDFPEFRSSSTTIIVDKFSAIETSASAISATVGEDQDLQFTVSMANQSGSSTIPWVDMVMLLPYNGDVFGSNFNGSYAAMGLDAPIPNLEVYVTTVAPGTLDSQDGVVDGYADPGAPTSPWYEAEGTGNWQYTLADVINGTAGAPTFAQVTALRLASNKAVDPFLAPLGSFTAQINLSPTGNVGVPSDSYFLAVASRVTPSTTPLGLASNTYEVQVVAPQLDFAVGIMQDPMGNNLDPNTDGHWGTALTGLQQESAYYRVKVTNTGTIDLTGVQVANLTNASFAYIAASEQESRGDATDAFNGNWTLDLAQGETATLVYGLDVAPGAPQTYTVTPTVSGTDAYGQAYSYNGTASLTTEADRDRDGIPDATDVCPDYPNSLDSDGDGVPNGCDEDDDNDGILDSEEAIQVSTWDVQAGVPNGQTLTNVATLTDGANIANFTVSTDVTTFDLGSQSAEEKISFREGENHYLTITIDIPIQNLSIFIDQIVQNGAGANRVGNVSFTYADNTTETNVPFYVISGDAGFPLTASSTETPFSTIIVDGRYFVIDPTSGNGTDQAYGSLVFPSTFNLPNSQKAVKEIKLEVQGVVTASAFLGIRAGLAVDIDSDNQLAQVDSDSDGDGCSDAIEAAFYDPDGDGKLGPATVTVDANGRVTSGTNGYTGTHPYVTDAGVSTGCTHAAFVNPQLRIMGKRD